MDQRPVIVNGRVKGFMGMGMQLNAYAFLLARKLEPEARQPSVINFIATMTCGVVWVYNFINSILCVCWAQPIGHTFMPTTPAILKDCEGVGEEMSRKVNHQAPPFTRLGRRARCVPGVICASWREIVSGMTSEPSSR